MSSEAQQSQGCGTVLKWALLLLQKGLRSQTCFVGSCVIVSILPKLTENSFLRPEGEAVCHL